MDIKRFIGSSRAIMVAFDRSGSFDIENEAKQLRALQEGLVGFSGMAKVVAFDHHVHWVDQIHNATQVSRLILPALFGGSDLHEVTTLAAGSNVDRLIVFTDGWVTLPPHNGLPTLFVLDCDPRRPVTMPYGESILLG